MLFFLVRILDTLSERVNNQQSIIDGQSTRIENLENVTQKHIDHVIPEPINGDAGIDGTDGKNGLNGKDGENGVDGTQGEDGEQGIPGVDGENGKTPEFLRLPNGVLLYRYIGEEAWQPIPEASL